MKLFLPKQHGAWAMLIIPFWLGAVASTIIWQHIPFFLGWLLLYLATYPMLLLFKKKKIPFYTKWTLIYLLPALILLLIPLWTRPGIAYFGFAMVPFFLLNSYFSSRNRDRALLNDMSAVVVFSIAGLASSFLGGGEVSKQAWMVFITSIIFFMGSTFYVKTMIREKKSTTYKWVSWGYHLAAVCSFLFAGEWLIAFAFLPSLGRAIYFYGKNYSVKKVGILEIVNAVLFFIIIFFWIVQK
ncbi:YwiC-like family protein [Cytobacillus spongiae]|uniref:YwiC-like family protein n=1 Tax=Cytobacillus spongiae TaxID=2901381 RepID=UPI001F21F391|nr:YwiC-like family protein [Cytobacillus spongiae]UII56987.1 YwiC-like family protein [Cytobacillus spongiae]